MIRARIFEADRPAATLANLIEYEARAGIGLELGLVIFQALVALFS